MSKRFTPVRGTEEDIRNLNIEDGHIYFASDTGHVYMDKDAETRIAISGRGSAVYLFDDVNPSTNYKGQYLFPVNKLTYSNSNFYSDTIKDDDIIVNLASGELFRILETDTFANNGKSVLTAICEKIALAGTSGGGDTPTPGINTISLELLSTLPYRFVYGREAYATFVSSAVGSTDINIRITVIGEDGSTHERTKMVQSGEEFEIEFGTLLFLGDNTILVSANGDNLVNSGTIEKRYRQRQATNLELRRPDGNALYNYQTGDFAFSYIPIGAVEKQIELFIDGMSVLTDTIPSNISGAVQTITVTREMITHEGSDEEVLLSGRHTLTLHLAASDEDGNNTIEAAPLEYEIAWFDEETTTAPIIWFPNGIPDTVIQYSTVNIEYMVFDPNKTKDMKVYLFKGEELTGTELSIDYIPGEVHVWTVSELDVGTNEFRIKCENTEEKFIIECTEITERDLGIIKDGLILNLDAAGRTNNEDIESRYTWPRGVNNGIEFNNFNWYNNGWITDEKTGLTCLRISNGASISIPFDGQDNPLNGLLNSEQLEKSLALEFRFKIRNVTKYTTLTTRGVEGNSDEQETVLTLEKENSVCGRLFGSQKGLLIGTQEAVFTYGPTLSVRYKEDEIINLSLVFDASNKLIYMYLNGILSSALHYNSFANLNTKATEISFNSEYCDLDLYSIRVYETDTVFSIENVIHNYIANLSGEERLNAYDINQIISYNYDTKEPFIDYYKMIAYNNEHPDTPLMPYAVVKMLSSDDLLPYRKGDEKPCEVTFVNPYLDYLWEHRNDVDTSKHPVIDGKTYLTSCPSFKYQSASKKNLNVQGTSSQGYPRRNFKLKTKGCNQWYYTNGPLAARKDDNGNVLEEDLLQIIDGVSYNDETYTKWYMDSSLPADKFCWKADYMESSGSYNTGFANFAAIMYEHHPLYNILKDPSYNTYRTSVYGFPMLLFQEKAERAEDGKAQYEFVGKYNFNLDKSSNTRYGFELKKPNPYITLQRQVNVTDDNGDPIIDPETGDPQTTIENYHPNIKDIAECWEFTNNQGTYCAFRTPWPTMEQSFAPIASDSFEYRYNPDEDGLDNFSFNGILEHDINPVTEAGKKMPIRDYFANFKILYDWLYEIGQIVDDAERQTRFKAEFDQHLNKEYCFVYFILTELLHCYDSRGKNMMLATWGPEKAGGEYIWYPIFYDVDTQLGLNNSGEQLWDYFAEPTDNDDFSTSNSVLWNCLWECYSTEIKAKYNSLRTVDKISFENLDGYYTFNPKYTHSLAMEGQRPLAVYNIDEYYKYIAPSLTGFIDTGGNLANDSFGHLYCLQGTRELSKALYLRNRINYLDSKWLSGAYAYTAVNGGGFETRLNANYLGNTSDIYIVGNNEGYTSETDEEWPNILDANPTFTIRPFLKQYVSVYYDRTATSPVPSDESQIYTIFNKVEKKYFLTNDSDFVEGKTYYYLEDNNEYVKIISFDGTYFKAAPSEEVNNLNYKNYYILTEQNEMVLAEDIEYDSNLTYYYRNVWEREYKVTPENFRDFYTKDLEGNYIQPNEEDESITYDDNEVYYELVRLINSDPMPAADSNLVTVIPSNDIIEAYKKTPNHTQQLAYVTGAEYIADLGDLSTKYFNQFNIGGAYRLENLTLGSDASIDGNIYENKVLKNILLATSKNDLHPKTLLKKINLNGLTNFNSFLDISGCEKLEEFTALRTALPQVAFADGVQLKRLHLPRTINTISLKKANKLTQIIDTPYVIENNEKIYQDGLYIQGLTDVEEPITTNLIKISIEGDYLGYNSYKLLDKLVKVKKYMKEENSNSDLDCDLAIGMRDINWTPYSLVPYGTKYDENINYYLDSGRFSLKLLTTNTEREIIKNNWNHYLSNQLIFVKTDENYGNQDYNYPITSLELLNTFIKDTRLPREGIEIDDTNLFTLLDTTIDKTKKAETQFSNDDPYEDQISLPDITGILFINNNNEISEIELKAYQKYFPKLRIFCENVAQGAKITYLYYKDIIPEDYTDNTNNVVEYANLAEFSDNTIIKTQFPVPNVAHYSFKGWKQFNLLSRLPEGDFISNSDGTLKEGIESITVNPKIPGSDVDNSEFAVIAIYEVEKYNITFVYQRSADGAPLASIVQENIPYNTPITMPKVTEYYPWKDDRDLAYDRVWKFLGYDKSEEASVASFTEKSLKPIAQADTTYYAVFKVESVTRNVLNKEFLNTSEENGIRKVWIDVDKGQILRGKITIPSKIEIEVAPKGKTNVKYNIFGSGIRPVISQEDNHTKSLDEITHIFWENDNNSNFTEISDYCFYDWQKLVYVDLPTSVKKLGRYAFANDNNSCSYADGQAKRPLFSNFGSVPGVGTAGSKEAMQFALNKLFANITYIADHCFATVYATSNWNDCYIPIRGDMTHIGEKAFAYVRIFTYGRTRIGYEGYRFGTPGQPLNKELISSLITRTTFANPQVINDQLIIRWSVDNNQVINASGEIDEIRIALCKLYYNSYDANDLISLTREEVNNKLTEEQRQIFDMNSINIDTVLNRFVLALGATAYSTSGDWKEPVNSSY